MVKLPSFVDVACHRDLPSGAPTRRAPTTIPARAAPVVFSITTPAISRPLESTTRSASPPARDRRAACR
jgi:hypothetical protein